MWRPLLPRPHVHLIRRHTTRIQVRNPSLAFPPSVYTMHCIFLPFLLCVSTTAAPDTKTLRILFLLCCELNLELCIWQSHSHRVTRPSLKSELQIAKLFPGTPDIPGLKKIRALETNILRQGSSHQRCSQELLILHFFIWKVTNNTPPSQDSHSLLCSPNTSELRCPLNICQKLKWALSPISCLGLNEIVFLNVLEQSLADKNHSLKSGLVITIIIMSQLGFEQKLF